MIASIPKCQGSPLKLSVSCQPKPAKKGIYVLAAGSTPKRGAAPCKGSLITDDYHNGGDDDDNDGERQRETGIFRPPACRLQVENPHGPKVDHPLTDCGRGLAFRAGAMYLRIRDPLRAIVDLTNGA